eukprot:SAG11_NODE_1211_length_5514_cov_40.185596_5_plen_268_part_00
MDTDQFAEGLLAHCRVEQALWDDVHDSDAPVAAPTSICSMPKHHGRMNGWMGAYNYSIYAALILWRVIVSTGEDDSDFLPRWTEDDWLGPIVYLVLVLVFFFMAVAEFGSAPVAQALSNSMDVTDATQSIEQLHNAAARIEFQADSWRPLKWKEPDAAIGKGVEVFYKRYTHRLKQTCECDRVQSMLQQSLPVTIYSVFQMPQLFPLYTDNTCTTCCRHGDERSKGGKSKVSHRQHPWTAASSSRGERQGFPPCLAKQLLLRRPSVP